MAAGLFFWERFVFERGTLDSSQPCIIIVPRVSPRVYLGTAWDTPTARVANAA